MATLADAAGLAAAGTRLFLQAYDGLIPAHEMQVHLAEDFNRVQQQSELADTGIATIILESKGDIAGFAQLRQKMIPIADAQAAEVELWRIYVDREWHGKGIAQQLIGKVGEVARSFSAQGIWLAVWEQNPRAIAFYRKIGFEAVGHKEFRVHTQVQHDIVMRVPADGL